MGHNLTILFVNPNRFVSPPVIPIAIEYLVHALRQEGMEVEVLDLCFSDDPEADLRKTLSNQRPDVVCFTIRNHDSVLYPETEYFLPEIQRYIKNVKTLSDASVIIGGSALQTDPEGIMEFLGADLAITGPGERSLPAVLKLGPSVKQEKKIIKGEIPGQQDNLWRFRPDRADLIDYTPYLERGGIVGFETHKGCSSHCLYCLEACSDVAFRDPRDVAHELVQLSRKGYDHFHLCDPEFNEDMEYCKELLSLMIREDLGIKWALYMKPGTCDKALCEQLRSSGAYLITLSVDTFLKSPHYWKHIEEMIHSAHENEIRVAIDLLSGFPYEDTDTLRRTLDHLRNLNPHEVVVNTCIRLYKNLPVTKIIEKDRKLVEHVINKEDNTYLSPVFYNQMKIGLIKELIGSDPLFRIAGEEKIVNYQKT
jgi:radical SAM superfamily enzyme YgiQ (UPF0313 family)